MSCKCQNCGKQYKADLIISDELWEKIKPKSKSEGGLFCMSCIGERIEDLGDYAAYKLVKI